MLYEICQILAEICKILAEMLEMWIVAATNNVCDWRHSERSSRQIECSNFDLGLSVQRSFLLENGVVS